MNRERFQRLWAQFGGKSKEQRGADPDEPFVLAAGRRNSIETRIRELCALSTRRAARQLREFHHGHRNWRDLSIP